MKRIVLGILVIIFGSFGDDFSGRAVGGWFRLGVILALSQALDLKVLGHCQEGVESVLRDVDLAVVDKVQDVLEIIVTDSPQVDHRIVGVRVLGILAENPAEEGTAGTEHDFVSLEGVKFTTDESQVE